MKHLKRNLAVACALAAVAVGAPAWAFGSEAHQAGAKLETAGYRNIHDLEYDDGLWEADVTRPDGSWGEVAVDPKTGEIFDERDGRPLLDAATVVQRLNALGYRTVIEIERDGAVWDVEAINAQGQRMDLRLGGHDGRLLHSQRDYD